MSGILPLAKTTFFDANGNPLAGGKVYFYIPGTTTPKDTYADSAGTLNTNPVVLDAAGRATIWGLGSYRQIVEDAGGATIWDAVTTVTVIDASVIQTLADALALTNLSTVGQVFYITGRTEASDGYQGNFQYFAGSAAIVAAVAADTLHAIYIPVNGDSTGASGALKRAPETTLYRTEWWGAKWDGVSDDTTAIDSAQSWVNANGGGVFELPPKTTIASITAYQQVYLVGAAHGAAYVGSPYSTVIRAPTSGGDVFSASGSIIGYGIINASLIGLGAATASKGLNLTGSAKRGIFRNLAFDHFADQAVYDDSAGVNEYDHLFGANLVLNTTRTSNIAAFEIHSNDNYIENIEMGVGSSADLTNQYIAAVDIAGANNMIRAMVGEFADTSVRISGLQNMISDSRADFSYGHGWTVTGSSNLFANCNAPSCCTGANNTYDSFHNNGPHNVYVNCQGWSSETNKPAYIFNDVWGTVAQAAQFVNCNGYNFQTAEFNTAAYGVVEFPTGSPILSGSASWTPGAIASGASVRTSFTVTGATFGDFVEASYGNVTGGCTISGYVGGANQVYVALTNNGASSVTPPSSTAYARVHKR